MPIEFRCPGCGKLLRVADSAGGKQAMCPACSFQMLVPPSSPAGEATDAPMPSLGPGGLPSPSSISPPPGPFEPWGGRSDPDSIDVETSWSDSPGGPTNPYASPRTTIDSMFPAAINRQFVAQQVQAPAIALIVMASLGILMHILGLVVHFANIAIVKNAQADQVVSSGVGLVMSVFGLAIGIVIIMGAIKMKNLESYGFSIAASILSMIPCISPCCLLGLPFGIWALVVLNDSAVKAAFQS